MAIPMSGDERLAILRARMPVMQTMLLDDIAVPDKRAYWDGQQGYITTAQSVPATAEEAPMTQPTQQQFQFVPGATDPLWLKRPEDDAPDETQPIPPPDEQGDDPDDAEEGT